MRTVLIPEDDGELATTLTRLEELLIGLQPLDEDDEPASANLGLEELAALQRISLTVHRIAWQEAADLFGPDGFNFGRVHAAQVAAEDLELVGRAIAALGASLLPGGDRYAREGLEELAGDFRSSRLASDAPGRLQAVVAEFAQAHGLLDLAPDADVELVAALTDRTGRVDLDVDQDAAYRRYLERVMAMNLNDPLQRFLFLG